MTAVRKYNESWRSRINNNTESTWKHIVRAADRFQPLLPVRNKAGGGWNRWRVIQVLVGWAKSPNLKRWSNGRNVEIECVYKHEVTAQNLPSLNRFGF